jgi:hypothetical protein
MPDYFQADAISRSHLMTASRSWEEYYARYIAKLLPSSEESDSMVRGLVAHASLLEPEAVNSRFAVIPEKMRRDPRTKAFRDFSAANEGKTFVRANDFQRAIMTAQALYRALEAAFSVSVKREAEVDLFWEEPETKLACKAKPDLLLTLPDRSLLVIDIKTGDERPNPLKFRRDSESHGYWMQDVHYRRGLEVCRPGVVIRDFVFAVIQTQCVYPCRLFRFAEETREAGAEKRNQILTEIRRRTDAGDWSDGRSDLITDVYLEV